ncbi:MAG: hypothetical protein R3C97_06015, partial [Geminicoccaceae bacterium]
EPPGEREIRACIDAGGLRAVLCFCRKNELDFLGTLPLEVLHLQTTSAPAQVLVTLTRLRELHVDSCAGALALARMPELEWFRIVEAGKGQLDDLWASGHERLRSLAVGRYQERDLLPLERLPALSRLFINHARKLESLDGLAGLTGLRHLDLEACSGLADLSAFAGFLPLTSLALTNCNAIADLTPVAGLGKLRSLVIDMRKIPTLAPLAGHERLEFIRLIGSRVAQEEIDTLLELPALRFLQARRQAWLREVEGPSAGPWIHIQDVYTMDESVAGPYHRMISEARTADGYGVT